MGNRSGNSKRGCCNSDGKTDHRFCNSDATVDYYSSSNRQNTEPCSHRHEDGVKINKPLVRKYNNSFQDSPYKENLATVSQERYITSTPTQQQPKHKHQSSSFILEVQNSFEEPDSTVLLEGELFRYKPGDKPKLIPRWGKLTKTQFFYYRNRISCIRGDKALLSVSISSFERVNQ